MVIVQFICMHTCKVVYEGRIFFCSRVIGYFICLFQNRCYVYALYALYTQMTLTSFSYSVV